MDSIVYISIFASIIFGIVESLNFLIIEKVTKDELKKDIKLEADMLALIRASITGITSIIIAVYLERYIESNYKTNRTPFIRVLGIIIGTILVIALFKLYTRLHIAYKKLQKEHTELKEKLNNIKDINIKEKLIKIGDEILSSIVKKLDQYIIH